MNKQELKNLIGKLVVESLGELEGAAPMGDLRVAKYEVFTFLLHIAEMYQNPSWSLEESAERVMHYAKCSRETFDAAVDELTSQGFAKVNGDKLELNRPKAMKFMKDAVIAAL